MNTSTRNYIAITTAALACCFAACTTSPDAAPKQRAQVITPDDFRAQDIPEPAPAQSKPATPLLAEAMQPDPAPKATVLLGPPTTAAPEPIPTLSPAPTRAYSVDQMVGQINGRPIYAHEFFAPMDARLRREAKTLDSNRFARKLQQDIWEALRGRLADELALAEFEAQMTPEKKMGVFAFIQEIRDRIVSRNYGAEDLAERRLKDEEGMTLDEKVDDITKVQFVREQLRREIGDRVQVSFREIQQEFDRHYDDFNPDPTARFRVLMIPKEEGYIPLISIVSHDIEQGAPFAEIVEDFGSWRREQGGLREVQLKDTTIEDVSLFSAPELNDPARKLMPGETTERIEFNDANWWIHLEDINTPPEITLYDVQLELEDSLLERRQREESTRYFQELYDRGSYSDIELMAQRLYDFALARYTPTHSQR